MVAPFVRVTINTDSVYAEPAPTTIPFIVFATRSAKNRPDTAGIALGTLESNKMRLVASQRELLQSYGNPVFVTSDGEPVHGDETNEYGLLAAHSVLGLTNRAYVARADLDMGQLIPTTTEPTLAPPDGTYWMESDVVVPGIFRWSGSAWVRIEDVTTVDGNIFHVFTSTPTGGTDGDWGWDYSSTIDGTFVFRDGGTWFDATDANLVTAFGAGTNMFVAATAPGAPVTGDYWYKTVSTSNGVDMKIKKYRASDSSWISQTVIRQNTTPTPSGGLIWEDISTINTDGKHPLYIGTGSDFIALTLVIQDTSPVSDPATGHLWYDDTFTDFALYVEGNSLSMANKWVPVTTTTNSNPTSVQKVISASAPELPSTGAIWVDVSLPQYLDNYPIIKRYSGSAWVDITDAIYVQSSDPDASAVANGSYWLNTGNSITRYTVKEYDPDWTASEVINGVASITVTGAGTGYTSIPTVAVSTGTGFVGYAKVKVLSATVNAGGTGGTPGTQTVSGTTGTGTKFSATVTVSGGGAITAVLSISVAGSYSVFPTDISQEPVTGAGLTGAKLAIVIGVESVVVTDGGSDFTGAAAVTFTGSHGATATATLDTNVHDETDNHWKPRTGTQFGRKSQRTVVVEALQSVLASNDEIRAEGVYYQLMAAPGYPELYDNLVGLNSDIGEITFIVGDTPKFMRASGISQGREITVEDWITNANVAATTGEEGFTSAPSPWSAFWTPWGLGTDMSGMDVFVPSSHIALRTIAYSDSISAPWFAPAGYPNGLVDNVSSVGYLTNSNEYQPVMFTKAQKDIIYARAINPITYRTTATIGNGLVIMGQKTQSPTASALDRIDNARLVLKIKYDLQRLLEPYLMKKNDAVTRRSALITTERYLAGLKSLRALYDYAARCDDVNNTADRIGQHELWVDVAIKPSQTIEFIYIPVNVLLPGDSNPF